MDWFGTVPLARSDAAPFLVGQTLTLFGFSLFLYRGRRSTELLRAFVVYLGLATILGCVYLYWKYKYFGYLLPNSFYVKSFDVSSFYGFRPVVRFVLNLAGTFGLVIVSLFFVDLSLLKKLGDPMSKFRAALLLVPPASVLLYDYLTSCHANLAEFRLSRRNRFGIV